MLAQSMGGDCEVFISVGYPFLKNDESLTNFARDCAIEYLGAENVADMEIRLGAEDFAYFSQQIPSSFYRLGINNVERGITSGLHTSTFDIDELALKTGMGTMAWLAMQTLKRKG